MTDHELLESSPRNFATTTQNKDDVTALTSAIGYEYETNSFGIYPMMRYESLDLCTRDDLLSTKKCFQSGYGSYGLGVNLFPTNHLQILTGVGTSIGAPSPSDESDTKLEEAINYELGVRFTQKTLRTEVIGFYSDYSNINGVCTQSSGCDLESLDQTFSGGRAQVYGIESSLSQIFMASGYRFPITASYTYTFGAFLNSSPSENPDWGLGIIQKGDPLPYIPEHRAFASAGIEDKKWGLHLSSSYTGTQFDQSVVENRKVLEPYNVIDLSTYYIVSEFCTIDVKVDNLADQKYVSSIRPYGYRPGKPQTFSFGVRSRF